MRYWLRRLILPASMPALLSLARAWAGDVVYLEYSGDLNQNNIIRLSLEHRERSWQGIYFYKTQLKDIPLSGEYTGSRDLVLREYDDQGKVGGIFFLKFVANDPRRHDEKISLDKEVLVGTWVNADSSKRYPVYLRMIGETRFGPGEHRYSVAGATDAARVERNAQAFYAAVLKGDKQTVAKYISYPLSYNDQGKRKQAKNQATFLRAYNLIFTKAFVTRLSATIPHNMFANANGIRLGQGEVWFDNQGRAYQLNN